MGVLGKSINNLYAGVFGTTCSFRKMPSKLRSATKTSLTLLWVFFPPIHSQKSHRTTFKTEVDLGIQALQRNKMEDLSELLLNVCQRGTDFKVMVK